MTPEVLGHPELLEENRFIATRDGMDARLLDPVRERLVPARLQLDLLLEACLPHAHALGCADELLSVRALADGIGAARQLELARGPRRAARAGVGHWPRCSRRTPPGPEGEPVAWRRGRPRRVS